MSDVDIIEAMQKTGSQKRYRPETSASNGTQPQQPIRVARASANRTAEQPLVVRTASQQRTADYRGEPRTNAPRAVQQQQPLRRTTQVYQEQQILPDTDTDVEVAPSVRPRSAHAAPPTRQLPPLSQQGKRQMHWLVYVGLGMVGVLLFWMIAVPVVTSFQANISDRWAHGPDHTAVLYGVFGHNKDSQAHPTRLEAYIDHGHIEVAEVAAGDPSHAHIYVGPTLTDDGWQGAVIDMQVKAINGKQDVLLDVHGTALNGVFRPQQELTLLLENTGVGGFKLVLAGGQ